MSPANIVMIARPLLHGLREMHREGAAKATVVHRNIQSASVLLNEKVGPLLFDFAHGVHSMPDSEVPHGGRVGPLGWIAPEVLLGFPFTEKVDVFCFALLLYEMRERKMPFADHHIFDLPRKIMAGDRPKCSPIKSEFAEADQFILSIMERCWAHQSAARPSFAELCGLFDHCAATHCQGSLASLEEVYHGALQQVRCPGLDIYVYFSFHKRVCLDAPTTHRANHRPNH
jgi:serine/threonine protein kinase